MANDAMWTPMARGWFRAPATDAGRRARPAETPDPTLQDLGYEAADPLLQAQLWGEAPVSWPAGESRP